MKKRILLILTLSVLLVLAIGAMSAGNGFADDEEPIYNYKVMIYSGQQGHFTGSGVDSTGTVWSKEFKPGELCEISTESLGFVLDNDKYYVRGFRLTGHDNDETTGAQNLTFKATEDVSYEIAYGIKGEMVTYTVYYQDEEGNDLRDPDTYYGMPGDKPVVAYRYVDGYEPDVYYQGQTLSENSEDNVFFFTYTEVEADVQTTIRTIPGQTGTQNGGAQNGGQNAPAAPGTVTNPTGTNAGNTPGADATIDDETGPTGNFDNGDNGNGDNGNGDSNVDDGNGNGNGNGENQTPEYIDNDPESPTSSWDKLTQNPALMGGLAAIILFLIALIIYLLRKKAKDEQDQNNGQK